MFPSQLGSPRIAASSRSHVRKEVEPLGIRVMVVEPGSMRTDFRGRSAVRSTVEISDYDKVLGRTGDASLGVQRGDPANAAAAILHAAVAAEAPRLLVLGSDALAGICTARADEAEDIQRFE